MSRELVTVKLNCLKCGGAPVTDDDNVTDVSIVKCGSCGHVFGTFAEVKAKAVETVRKDSGVDAIFKDIKDSLEG